ncbi:unnamed protein product [Protopolystoma xenopodis]|uniref:Uncharacterized protein n=1 Tax=Protopolystoma xenopodis TaxID=117903 RepID=A0A448WV77_9PLAT|nr:unnamed protein product [Protopolystoma xenopodis]
MVDARCTAAVWLLIQCWRETITRMSSSSDDVQRSQVAAVQGDSAVVFWALEISITETFTFGLINGVRHYSKVDIRRNGAVKMTQLDSDCGIFQFISDG